MLMDVGSSIGAQVMDFAGSANPYLPHMDVPLDSGSSWKNKHRVEIKRNTESLFLIYKTWLFCFFAPTCPNCDPNSVLKITSNDCQTQTQQFHPRILFQNSTQPHSTPRGLPIHSACLSTSLGWYGAKLWGYAFGYGINQQFFWPMKSCKANLPCSYGNLERDVSRCWYQTTYQNTSGFETEEPQPHPSTKLALNVCMKHVCICLFLMANPNVCFLKQLQCLPC